MGPDERSPPSPAARGTSSVLQVFLNPDFRRRAISAVIMVPVAIALVYLGSWPFALLVMVVALLMSWEWGHLVRGARSDGAFYAHVVAVAAAVVLAAAGHSLFAVAALLIGAAVVAWLTSAETSRLSAIGVFYVGLPAVILLWLRQDRVSGFDAIIFLFLVVWTTDTMAYVAGRSIGGPKLWPQVSPNKTWSGFLGGLFAAMAISALFAAFVPGGSPLRLALLGGALSLVSQGGDLAESALKRGFGVKDASHLIPGHGGLMDRLDGFVTASIAAGIIALVANRSAPATALLLGG